MTPIKWLALVLLLPFSVLTAYALLQVGYVGIFEYHRHSPAGWQVFSDLVIGMLLIIVWMVADGRARGRNPWPFVALTLLLGSFGPLLYLLFAPVESSLPQST